MKTNTTWNPLNVHARPQIIRPASKLPSLTVPDQSMSMRTLVERFASGTVPYGLQNPIYGDIDDLGINLKTLDLTERQEILESAQAKIKQYRDVRAKHELSEKTAAQKEAIRKEIEQERLDESLKTKTTVDSIPPASK